METILLNLAYILMMAAFVVRDILWLRLLLIASQLSFVAYALTTDTLSMTVWNTGFIAVNVIQSIRIFRRRRPVTLSSGLESVYRESFSPMTRREFLYFWQTGREKEVSDELIVRQGVGRGTLFYIAAGEVAIERDGREVARIGRGNFIADSSAVLGEGAAPISARAVGTVGCVFWDRETISNLQKVSPEIVIKLQKIVGSYLTGKLRAALDGG